MAKAKKKPAGRVIVGGVNRTEQERAVLARSIRGTVEKRRDDKFRLRLGGVFAVGEKLIVEGDFETALAVVQATHPHGLIDVVIRGGLFDQHAHVVHVRRAHL